MRTTSGLLHGSGKIEAISYALGIIRQVIKLAFMLQNPLDHFVRPHHIPHSIVRHHEEHRKIEE